MTIHSDHPFVPAEGDRDPLRRFRGRMVAPVSVWAAGTRPGAVGWTVSSFLIADGRPAELLGLLDDESDLAGRLESGATLTVSLLSGEHRGLADAFAGLAPAPGGVFRLGTWVDTEWGPVLADAPAWLGARIEAAPAYAGWALLVRAVIERVEIGPQADPADGLLTHLRGRYRVTSTS